MSAKQILLEEWARRKFDPPPARRTLRAWAKDRIFPRPVLVGRDYRVTEDAEYVPPQRLSLPEITVLESDDPIVKNIITSGQTEKRRKA